MNLTWINKTILYIVLVIIILVAFMFFLTLKHPINIENYLTIIGFWFLAISAILLYFQIRTNLTFSKRKAAFDFITSKMPNELIPMFKDLSVTVKAESVSQLFKVFSITEVIQSTTLSDDDRRNFKKITIAILNFYERMAIGIFKEVLDNDICYDDVGNNLIMFYKWVKPFIESLQSEHNEERLFVNFEILAIKWTDFYEKIKIENKERALMVKRKQTIKNPKL